MTRSRAMGRVVMVQGTMSHSGKSVLATALCRILVQDGLQVAPFKAQNMSLNSYATPDGAEIGRAQAVQAAAAMVAPTVDMNPVLLKPEGERRSQVVVLGRASRGASVREYHQRKKELWREVAAALDRLRAEYDVVVIEGAGSPAEINLKQHEIVNMRVARYAQAPVLLVGDIERGGVFAQLAGTMLLLEPEERALVKAFVINKFRGDPSLLDPGLEMLGEHTGVPVIGVLPYFTGIHIPEEDSLGLESGPEHAHQGVLDIAVIRLPHIANFDDFDPLRREPGVGVRYVANPGELRRPDLIIVPGSKTTVHDLEWLRRQGLDDRILALRREGTPVIGICGGYQMLGEQLLDPDSVESPVPEARGLGLLPATTVFQREKATHQVEAQVVGSIGLLEGCLQAGVKGYEIHMGVTRGDGLRPAFRVASRSGKAAGEMDGALDADGLTLGTYMHGLFHNRAPRRTVLEYLAERKGVTLPAPASDIDPDDGFDALADLVRRHLDMDHVYHSMGLHK